MEDNSQNNQLQFNNAFLSIQPERLQADAPFVSNAQNDGATNNNTPLSPLATEQPKKVKTNKIKKTKEEKPDKTEKHVPNVDVWQCVRALIFSIFILCLALIPLSFATDSNGEAAYTVLPIIGNGKIVDAQKIYVDALLNKFGLMAMPEVVLYAQIAVEYCFYVFYGILVANVLFNLVLILVRLPLFRILFKIISILAGFAMIIVSVTLLATIIGFFISFIDAATPLNQLGEAILGSGIIFVFINMIFAFALIGKQFRWYAKYY